MFESVEKEGQRKDNDTLLKINNFDPLEDGTPNWSCYKLIIDPDLSSGSQKVYRYDGQHFSAPHPGCFPVDVVRDPRTTRFWTKFKETNLLVPKFKVDEHYVGAPKELTFARLNDNIRDEFLSEMCKQFGEVQDLKVLYNPKNKKHLGIAKVIFESVKAANNAVKNLHNTSVMGNNIHLEFDPKGVKRNRYVQMLVSGLYTPFTLPVGEEAWGLQSPSFITDSFTECEPLKKLPFTLSSLSSICNGSPSLDCSTPLSMDTAYSSMHQDTPNSFWQTPQYQDTPCTPSMTHSRPGTPSQFERTPNESALTSSAFNVPFIQQSIPNISQQQPVHLTQPVSNKPSIIQGAVQNFWMLGGAPSQNSSSSNRQRTPGRNYHLSNHVRGGHRVRPLESKYQNAYNRRPQHNYIHRPVYRGGHHRSVPLANQASFNKFQESSTTPSHSDKLTVQTFTGSVKGLSVNHRSVAEDLPSLPNLEKLPRKAIVVNVHHIHSDMQIHVNASENIFNGIASQVSCKTQEVNQTYCPPQAQSSRSYTPKLCPSSETTEDLSDPIVQCPSPESPAPESKPESLDSRIQMLLSAGSPVLPLFNQDNSDSETATEEHDPSHSPSCSIDVVLNCDQTSSSANNTGSHLNKYSDPKESLEDASFTPLCDMAKDEHELQSIKKPLSKISTSTTVNLKEDEDTSDQPSRIPVICTYRSSLPPPIPQMPPHPILLPPSSCSLYPPPKIKQVCKSPNWQSSAIPLPIPTRITQVQTSFSPPLLPPPFNFMTHRPPYPSAGCSSTMLRFRPPWPPPPMPRFDPSVPPPGYVPMKELAQKATVDGVLAVVAAELRAIVKKDIHRRMIEIVSFKAFDQWWDDKEHAAKVSAPSVKSGGNKDIKLKVMEQCGSVLGTGKTTSRHGAIKLPSFKLKRKDPLNQDSSDVKRICPSPGLEQTEEEEPEQQTALDNVGEDMTKNASEETMVKRRHSRPLVLESEEEEDDENSEKMANPESEEVDVSLDGDEMKADELHKDMKSDACVLEDEDCSDSDTISHTSSNLSASKSQGYDSFVSPRTVSDSSAFSPSVIVSSASSRSVFDSSDDRSVDSSDSLSSGEEDQLDGERSFLETPHQDRRIAEEIWISSDEDNKENQEMIHNPFYSSFTDWEEDLGPPVTPSAPDSVESAVDHDLFDLNPRRAEDPEEELSVRVYMHGLKLSEPVRYTLQDPVKHCLTNKFKLPDPVIFFSEQESELPSPPSPTYRGLSDDLETQYSTDSEDQRVITETLKDSENLRPITPTGSLSDSDPEMELGRRFSPPAIEEFELPHTPGGCLEMEEAEGHILHQGPPTPLPPPPSPTGIRHPSSPLFHCPPLTFLYPAYEETPKTPSCFNGPSHVEGITPAGLQQEALQRMGSPSNSILSPCADSMIPRTPGRDMSPSPPVLNHGERTVQQRELRASGLHHQNFGFAQSDAQTNNFCIDNGHEPHNRHIPSRQTESLDSARLKRRRARLKMRKRMIELQRRRQCPNINTHSSLQVNNVTTKSSSNQVLGCLDCVSDTRTEQTLPEAHRQKRLLEDKRKPNENQRVQESSCLWRKWRESTSRHHLIFSPRSERREKLIIHAVWTKGVNEEEIRHLKATYERLVEQDKESDWLRRTRWIPHPPTSTPDDGPIRWLDGIRNHVTGCARSEGYYFISKREKLRYLCDEFVVDTQGKSVPAQIPPSSRSGSELRAEQRRLLSSFSCDSDLLKFNQLKFRKKKLRFGKSRIHDWGLFAEEPIAADEMIIEYVGQSIRQVIADMRERRYENEGIGSSYLFRVDQDTIIDATKCGNMARFINHSCNPNCYAKVISVEAQKKIVIYSRQPIGVNEEITYDYKFPIEDEKIPCLCAAENCRGTLN
ncbi:histone-lysine N-methyltransferase SETD1B-A [Pimephales promelas]|uniref:histone-lysine N-methyltransferase SETD1B-A n=1 Tax=Pimephales promelas TaxID=90988 RepID=UPI001955BAC3|nr:histone-lysine N-methyltransferase SETD1B-A [Pimephales promelas]KAG1974028.1 histone-lysine N-methyltransferase SETD1A [Pimephales promelas]KAG1974029.1 histone-lysine N-methyltransferase SETD1A [Pimephales promelas]